MHQVPIEHAAQTRLHTRCRTSSFGSVIACRRTLLTTFQQPSSPSNIPRRHFWWCRPRTWTSQLDPQFQRHIERRYKVLRHKYAQAVRRQQLWDREVTEPKWRRLSSSWGTKGPGGRWVDTDRLASQQREVEGTSGSSLREGSSPLSTEGAAEAGSPHSYVERSMQVLRRRLDEDPFGTLFGRQWDRLERSGPWTPHGILKSLSWGSSPFSDVQDHKNPPSNADHRPVNAGERQGSVRTAEGLQKNISSKVSQEPKVAESCPKSTTTAEFDIDPITMRKVHRTSTISRSDQGPTIIPIKTFQGRGLERSQSRSSTAPKTMPKSSNETSSAPSSLSSPSRLQGNGDLKGGLQATTRSSDNSNYSSATRTNGHDAPNTMGGEKARGPLSSIWLTGEGIGSTNNRRIDYDITEDPQGSQTTPSILPVTSTSDAKSSTSKSVTLPDSCEADLDLLRPADVRASAGIIKRPKETTGTEAAGKSVSPADHSQEARVSSRVSSEDTTSLKPAPDSASGHARPELTTARVPVEENEMESRKERDKQLVQEIRGIYEDNYGVIDTKHRQARNASANDLPLAENPASSQARKNSENVKANPGKATYAQVKKLSTKQAEGVVPEAVATLNKTQDNIDPIFSGLSEYEQKLGPKAYRFKDDQDSSETGILKPAKSIDPMSISMESGRSGEKLRPRPVEQEHVPESKTKEGNDALEKIKAKLDFLIREQEVAEAKPVESAESKESSPIRPGSPAVYKVLALDPSRQEVVSAGTTSSTATESTNEQVLSPAEVIPRLHSPARFLPYFNLLQAEGYEIVSGEGDVLVFKKVREPIETTSRAREQAASVLEAPAFHRGFINPIDGTTTTGNFASPTGFVNYDSILPPQTSEVEVEDLEADGTSNTISRPPAPTQGEAKLKTSGEEKAADTDTQQQHGSTMKGETFGNSVRGTVKRMVWVGAWVAGCSYLVGVLMETL